jgi:hypothetical protein
MNYGIIEKHKLLDNIHLTSANNHPDEKNMLNYIKLAIFSLPTEYYLRQLFFSVLLSGSAYYIATFNEGPLNTGLMIYICITTLIYPYSRYLYESVISFIMGNNSFYIDISDYLFYKLLTMCLCWSLAIFIAPISLLFLFLNQVRRRS